MITKVLQLPGLSVELDYAHLINVNLREELDSLGDKGRKPVHKTPSSDIWQKARSTYLNHPFILPLLSRVRRL